MDFKNSIALVTGASSGIGRQIALDLAAHGATVVASSRSLDRLAETAAALRHYGGASEVVECDVSDAAAVRRMVSGALAKFGRVDILVNNAGFGDYGPLAETPIETIEAMLRTNYLGTVYCTKEVLPSMIARRSGAIVNISSISGIMGTPELASYCATKFAQIGFSESLYHELKPHGVHVAVVCPGPVRTNFRRAFDERAPKPPEFMVLDAADVSRATMRAIAKKKFQVVLPRSLALICYLKGVFPGLVRFLTYHAMRAANRRS
ncbi:MAG TPA: SDR family oxidoreductase [Candidatus Binatia bacterium]|nr:SDR family oxidoreductase [Candidatus Binatia bacterium]